MNKYEKQINFTNDIRRAYNIFARYDNNIPFKNLQDMYIAVEPDILGILDKKNENNEIEICEIAAILDFAGVVVCYLPDLLLLKDIFIELVNISLEMGSLTIGQRTWFTKEFSF